MLNLFLLLVTCFFNLVLGLFVLLRNSRQRSNIAFFCVSLSITLWAVSNYLVAVTSVPLGVNRFFNHVVFLFAFFAIVSGAWFVTTFSHFVSHSPKSKVFAAIFGGIIAVLSIFSVVAGNVTKVAPDKLSFSIGPLLPLYLAGAVFFVSVMIADLLHVLKKGRGREKQQAAYVLVGFTVPIILGLITNVIIPTLTSSWKLANFGPLFTMMLVGIIGYATIRHRLFDLRLIVARSIAYTLTLGIIAGVYGFASYYITTLFAQNHSKVTVAILNVTLIIVAVTVYPKLKNMFDRLSNKLFYRDAYDPQAFLDQLNQALVSNIDLEKLLNECAKIIAMNLKASYCLFGIKETDVTGLRLIGTTTKNYDPEDVALVRKMTPLTNATVIATDALPPEADDLRQRLIKNDVAVLARLVPEFAANKEGLGYIILGPKRSGNIYTTQDERMMGIIANELVIAIQNTLHYEEIQRFTITLQQKVEDATRRLRASNSRLKVLDETKDDFISMASHQLRTPLTSVKGYLSLVLDGDAGPIKDNQRKLLTQAFISSQRMVYLIADLLNVSRLKTGKFIIESAPISLADIVQEEVDQLVETAESRQLTLTYHKPAHFPVEMLDETKIRQVAMNFMDNAIYYTPAGGHINIEVSDTPKSIEFRVIDDGIGVPKDEQHHLFTKFYRAKNAQRARPDGTGLGLFMAQKVVVAQGGAVIFSSKEGQGSTFGFTFPKDKLQVPATSTAESK